MFHDMTENLEGAEGVDLLPEEDASCHEEFSGAKEKCGWSKRSCRFQRCEDFFLDSIS